MSTTVETNKVTFTGNGATVDFAFTFRVFAAADLEVYLDGVLKTLTTHYTVTIDSSVEGGTVTFLTAPASSVSVLIKRVLDYTQPSDLPTEGNFPEITVENALDRATMLIIQLKEILSRVPQLAITSTFSDLVLPEPSASKYLGWNSLATAMENKSAPTNTDYPGSFTFGLDSAKSASPAQGDIYFAVDTNILYKCSTSSAWSPVMEQAKGADVASATSTDIWAGKDGEFLHVTGTTTITSFATAPKAGATRTIVFDGVLTLTHHATNLIIPGGSSITTAAGDIAIVRAETTTTFRVVSYMKASGLPVVSSTVFTPNDYTSAPDSSSSDEVTTSSTYSDTTLSQTFTVGQSGLVFANFAGRGDSASGICFFRLVVDGVAKAEQTIPGGGTAHPLCLGWSGILAAGSHTIKVQFKNTDNASACTLKGTSVAALLNIQYPT